MQPRYQFLRGLNRFPLAHQLMHVDLAGLNVRQADVFHYRPVLLQRYLLVIPAQKQPIVHFLVHRLVLFPIRLRYRINLDQFSHRFHLFALRVVLRSAVVPVSLLEY